MIRRREFLTGAAALAAFSRIEEAEALVGSKRVLLAGGKAAKPSIPRNQFFGVNANGPEFAPVVGQTWPSANDAGYLAKMGVGFVRLPIAWESLQPTLGAALNATYVANMKSCIAALNAQGIGVIVDLHNFGHYAQPAVWNSTVTYAGNGGVNAANVNFLGDGVLTAAVLADVWTRLATALVGTPGLIGYGIMNEPTNIVGKNLLVTPNYFSGQFTGWGIGATEAVAIQAAGSNPLGAAYGPAWTFNTTNFGNTSQSVTVAAGTYTLSGYISAAAAQSAYLQIDAAQTAAAATSTPTRFSATAALSAGAHIFSIGTNGPGFSGTGAVSISNLQLESGASPTAYEPNPFMSFGQAAINAIRAVDAGTPIYVTGAPDSRPAAWQMFNFELAQLTGGGLVFDSHQYFDGPQGIGGGGTYSGTFTSYGIDTQTGVQALPPFTDWLTARGVTGFLGEFGVPNNTTDNNPQWLPTQVNFEQALANGGVRGTQWYFNTNKPLADLNIAPNGAVNDPRLTQMLAVQRMSPPDWVPSGADTVIDIANGRSYFSGTVDTIANNSLGYLVTGRSQTNVGPNAGDLRAGVTWSPVGLGASTTGVAAPDGTATAFKIVEDGNSGRHLLFTLGGANLTIPAGSVITAPFVLKAAERGFAIVTVQDSAGNNFFASVNLSTGSIASVGSGLTGKTGTAAFISASSIDLGGGWWLFSITGTVDPAATLVGALLDLSNTLGSNSYQGVAGNGIYAWCCPIVLGSAGSIPIPSIGLQTTAQPTSRLLGTQMTLLPLDGANAYRIVGDVLTNAAVSGQQAAYLNINQNNGQNVRQLGADWKFIPVAGGLNGAATLAVWKTQPITTAAPPNSGCHLAMGRTNWIFGKTLNGNPVVPIASGSYSLGANVPVSGTVLLNGNTATVRLPDGSVQEITDPDIGAQAGPWATFEAFQNDAAADDRTGFYKVWLG